MNTSGSEGRSLEKYLLVYYLSRSLTMNKVIKAQKQSWLNWQRNEKYRLEIKELKNKYAFTDYEIGGACELNETIIRNWLNGNNRKLKQKNLDLVEKGIAEIQKAIKKLHL